MSKLYPLHPVLLVDDEKLVLESLEFTLNMNGITNTIVTSDSTKVLSMLTEGTFTMVITDLLMPGLPGIELLRRIIEAHPHLPVIVVTGVNEVKTAVDCMKIGAVDYVMKPVEKNEFISAINHAIELVETRNELESIKKILFAESTDKPEAYKDFVAADKTMMSIFQYLHAIKHSRKPLLITGDTGVGKDVLARAFHNDCGETGQFIAVNVGGLDDNMFSDTLFGHIKGAFTGAQNKRNGMISEAEHGTLFLDEIGDLSAQSQVKLLRLMQSGEYLPLGSETHKVINARLICATNVDLDQAMKDGSFRKDLYYRLKTHHIHIPALHKRKKDIPLLVDYFIEKSASELQKPVPTVPPELYAMLKNYSFPGNVRELESIVHEAVSVHQKGKLSLDVFHRRISFENSAVSDPAATSSSFQDGFFVPAKGNFPSLNEIERLAILEALERAEGNQSLAAQLLGVSRHTIMRKLKHFEQ